MAVLRLPKAAEGTGTGESTIAIESGCMSRRVDRRWLHPKCLVTPTDAMPSSRRRAAVDGDWPVDLLGACSWRHLHAQIFL
jgi:hypothetical protein